MKNKQELDRLASSLIDLMSFLSSPQRDEFLLYEADVTLDRALFPLLVRIGMKGSLGVAELADNVGRDHTTVSRQLAKLENLDLIERCGSSVDRRRRNAQLTSGGKEVVLAITRARRRLLSRALAEWSDQDRSALADLTRRFADALIGFAHDRR